jgi:hypothetical protein
MSIIESKAQELRQRLSTLGKELRAGNESELLVWVIPDALACAHRPLRHHPVFGGSGKALPPEAAAEVFEWVRRIREYGVKSIICLMHPKELQHYARLDLDATDLIDLYWKAGFEVQHIPWEDPAHRPPSERTSFQGELERVRDEALSAFDALPRPVLLHCSAGIDRSSPVAAFIFAMRSPLADPT